MRLFALIAEERRSYSRSQELPHLATLTVSVTEATAKLGTQVLQDAYCGSVLFN
jgi:hypothetical protein